MLLEVLQQTIEQRLCVCTCLSSFFVFHPVFCFWTFESLFTYHCWDNSFLVFVNFLLLFASWVILITSGCLVYSSVFLLSLSPFFVLLSFLLSQSRCHVPPVVVFCSLTFPHLSLSLYMLCPCYFLFYFVRPFLVCIVFSFCLIMSVPAVFPCVSSSLITP